MSYLYCIKTDKKIEKIPEKFWKGCKYSKAIVFNFKKEPSSKKDYGEEIMRKLYENNKGRETIFKTQ